MRVPKMHMMDPERSERLLEPLHRVLRVPVHPPVVWSGLVQDHPELRREEDLVYFLCPSNKPRRSELVLECGTRCGQGRMRADHFPINSLFNSLSPQTSAVSQCVHSLSNTALRA